MLTGASYVPSQACYSLPFHRMAEAGRDVWKPSGPTILLKQCSLRQQLRTMPRWLLTVSKDRDSTGSLGSWASAKSPSQ